MKSNIQRLEAIHQIQQDWKKASDDSKAKLLAQFDFSLVLLIEDINRYEWRPKKHLRKAWNDVMAAMQDWRKHPSRDDYPKIREMVMDLPN